MSSTISSHVLLTPNGKRRGRKPGLNSTVAQRSAANARERSRMRVLSGAFVELKGALPWVPKDTKLSKLDTLKLASGYIAYLKRTLDDDPNECDDSLKQLKSERTELDKQIQRPEVMPLFHLVAQTNKNHSCQTNKINNLTFNSKIMQEFDEFSPELQPHFMNPLNTSSVVNVSNKSIKQNSFANNYEYEEPLNYLDTDGYCRESFDTMTGSSLDSLNDSSDTLNKLFTNYLNTDNDLNRKNNELNFQSEISHLITPTIKTIWPCHLAENENMKLDKPFYKNLIHNDCKLSNPNSIKSTEIVRKEYGIKPTWPYYNQDKDKLTIYPQKLSNIEQFEYFSQPFIK